MNQKSEKGAKSFGSKDERLCACGQRGERNSAAMPLPQASTRVMQALGWVNVILGEQRRT